MSLVVLFALAWAPPGRIGLGLISPSGKHGDISHAEGRRLLRRYDFVFDIDMGAAVGTKKLTFNRGQDGETLGVLPRNLAELDETDPN